jgi:hypothetical protein
MNEQISQVFRLSKKLNTVQTQARCINQTCLFKLGSFSSTTIAKTGNYDQPGTNEEFNRSYPVAAPSKKSPVTA